MTQGYFDSQIKSKGDFCDVVFRKLPCFFKIINFITTHKKNEKNK